MSIQEEKVAVSFEIDRETAWALAQFCKRTTHQDCADRATSENEAYSMHNGVNAVMHALTETGVSPR